MRDHTHLRQLMIIFISDIIIKLEWSMIEQ